MGGDIVTKLRAIAKEKSPPPIVIKKFQILVNEKEQDIAKEINVILDGFYPRTNLQQLLKCKLIDQFKVSSQVIGLLQSCESLKVNQAMKCKWFFKELKDPEGFIRDVIPSLSLSTRLKVINKYASLLQDTKSGEILYIGIKSRYGLRAASTLLPVCGENLIRNELPNIKFRLDPNVVTALLSTYPALSIEYLKYLADKKSLKTNRQNLSTYNKALLQLSNQDFKSFFDLYENHTDPYFPYLKLGRRATKKLIKEEADKVLNDYDKYKPILAEKTFFHRLSLEQLNKVYLKAFLPEEISSILNSSMRVERIILKYIRPSVRPFFLASAFTTKYGRNFTDEDILFKLQDVWVTYMPEDDKVKWIEMKLRNDCKNECEQASYISYLPVPTSIPRLKRFIESVSNPVNRQAIAEFMIDSICINRAASSIRSLLEYFNKRFRNEVDAFHSRVLNKMRTLGTLYLELEDDDWAPIIELFHILKLRDSLDYNIYDVVVLLSHRLHSTFLKQGNVESDLEEAHELLGGGNHFLQLCKGTPFRANILSMILRRYEKPDYKKQREEQQFCVEVLDALCIHLRSKDKENSKVQIEIPKWIFSNIDQQIKARPTTAEAICFLEQCMRHLKTLPDKTLWVHYTEKLISSYPTEDQNLCYDDLVMLMRRKPLFVQSKIKNIMKITSVHSNTFSRFCMKCRLYDAWGFTTTITNIYHGMMSDPDDRPHAIGVLSILLPPSEYIDTVSQFTPTETKIKEYNKDVKALYETQQGICKSFSKISNPIITLPLIKKYAVGDYLKLVLGSLISTCVKVPENEILKIINDFMDSPVSLRKHLLRMTILIAPTEQKISTIVGVFKKEKNISLRLLLFNLLSKGFHDEPDDENYKIFSSTVALLTAEDRDALKLVFDISELDDSYALQYLELLWHLDGTVWENANTDGKAKIVAMMHESLLIQAKEDFFKTLLQYEFSRTLPFSSPGSFVSKYLVHSPTHEAQVARLNNVWEELSPLITSCWNKPNLSRQGYVFPVRYIVSDLIDQVCSNAVQECHVSPTPLLNELKKRITPIINPEHFLEERLKLDLAIAHPSCGDNADVTALVDLYRVHLKTYGPQHATEIIEILIKNAPDSQRQQMAFELIKLDEANGMCQIVGIKLLTSQVTEKSLGLYRTLVETLLASRDPHVQAVAHTFFKQMSTASITLLNPTD